MTTEILIVTYARDFRYLKYCLRSVNKFARDFARCNVIVPHTDVGQMSEMIKEWNSPIPLATDSFLEWPGKGMLHHMYIICCADEWLPQADRILHMDADCFFSMPASPADYLDDQGRPIMVHAPYDWLIAQQGNFILWQQAVERALGWKPVHEFMRRHPSVYRRDLYPVARKMIEQHTGRPFREFIMDQRNEYPQTFAEFPTLGEVAWVRFHNDYVWRDQSKDEYPNPDRMEVCWSHREPTPHDIARFEKAGLL